MADPRFFPRQGPFTLSVLARIADAGLADPATAERQIHDVAPIEVAGADDLTFLDNPRYQDRLRGSRAGACVLAPAQHAAGGTVPDGMACLLAERPRRAYALIAAAFYPEPAVVGGVHPRAVVDDSARLAPGSRIDAGAVIGARAEIGAGAWIEANAVIGDGVVVGARSRVGANATVSHAIIGEDVRLYPGVRIGQDGFGFESDSSGHLKVPQLGRVIVEDRAEIGANVTIDRGAGPDTVIGAGTMIDNLVQIGHNVATGRNCVLVAQSGVSGSTRLGDFVVLAAQAGLTGHLSVGDGAQIGAQAGVTKDVPAGARIVGSPAVPFGEFARQVAAVKRLVRSDSRGGAAAKKGE